MAVLKRQQLDQTVAPRSARLPAAAPPLPDKPESEDSQDSPDPHPQTVTETPPQAALAPPPDAKDPWEQEGELLAQWQERTQQQQQDLGPKERKTEDRRAAYRRVEEKELLSRAHQEADAIRESARQQGYQQGLQEALQKSDAELQAIHEMLVQMMSGREEALNSVSNEIAGLAVQVAEQIIKTEVSCDDTLVLALVQDVIQKAGRSVKSLNIKVHPQQVALIKAAVKPDSDSEMLPPGLQADVSVSGDPNVEVGSCIIETNSGMVDARFQTQLAFLRKLLGIQTPIAVSSKVLPETSSAETPELAPPNDPAPDQPDYEDPFSDVIEPTTDHSD